MASMILSRQQITLLITLTLVWGFNWPVLKLGVSDYPPLSFRSLSMWMGLPFLALVLYAKKVPFKIPLNDWKELFVVIEDASTAPKKKPHPQVYVQTLARLGLPAANCLAIEDSSNGLRAAVSAGLKTIITQNRFTAHHDFSDALQVLPDLSGVSVEQLRTWHQ